MRTVDKTKKSNIKCEHCRFFVTDPKSCYGCNRDKCTNPNSPKYGVGTVHYWNRCKCFEWNN